MAITAAETALIGAIGRWGYIRQTYKGAGTTGTDFLYRADAAADETYDLWCNVWETSECDTLVANANVGDSLMFYKWYQPVTNYLLTATTADRAGMGYASWDTYLAAMRWRVNYEFGELFYDRTLTRLATTAVGAKGIYTATIGTNVVAGLHDFGHFVAATSPGPGTFTANEGDLDITKTVGSPIIWNSNSSGGDVVATIIVSKFANADYSLSVDMTGAANVQGIIGSVPMTSGETAAATALRATTCAAGRFVAGDYVLIYETDALQEIAVVASMITDTSMTVTTGIRHTYTNAAVIYPLYTGITSVTGTAGTLSKEVDFYARPDKLLAL
jgi:hypothetical protein